MDETEDTTKESQSGQLANSSDIEVNNTKPKHAGGRKPKGYYERGIQDILDSTAHEAALLLDRFIHKAKGFKFITTEKLAACKFVIDHAVGKSKQKIEHSGGILTYAALAKGASELDSKPRPILADVMEIANKYDRDHLGMSPASSEGDKES